MKNKLANLNDRLFEQLDRLNLVDLSPERLALEVSRTEAMVKVGEQIIGNATIMLRAAELVAEHGGRGTFEHLMPAIGDAKQLDGPKK
ncbi:MAG: hypothetical protein U0172_03580 [Nitrospiraceae bacterium]